MPRRSGMAVARDREEPLPTLRERRIEGAAPPIGRRQVIRNHSPFECQQARYV
jgi:hypothetical protein